MNNNEERFVLATKKVVGWGSVVIDRETGVNYLWFPKNRNQPIVQS
ncbi:hypothetical protein NRIC_35620 [Enterococcus florum]|uniref:Uncharacterized protein n=1 Tax=Enterococcus florum TaxID=2480627 RepID=A0A4P5PGX0_9ENTE|nr:hypothetical protein [Enterococcus florum]GCF95671.1 hypothetical protein NRIC_35620 [Enterococcus florum]